MKENQAKKQMKECTFKPGKVSKAPQKEGNSIRERFSKVFKKEILEDNNCLLNRKEKLRVPPKKEEETFADRALQSAKSNLLICVDLAFEADDHERIEIYEGDDLEDKIKNICEKRGILDAGLRDRIKEIVEAEIERANL